MDGPNSRIDHRDDGHYTKLGEGSANIAINAHHNIIITHGSSIATAIIAGSKSSPDADRRGV